MAHTNDVISDNSSLKPWWLELARTFDGWFRRLWPQTDIASARLNDLEVFYGLGAERGFGAAA